MAKLTDLPPETLLTITSFIWSGLPAKKRLFDASISKEKHALAKSLNREGLSVINLASTCKYLHRVLAADKYRFVSIPRCNSAQKLLSLLRLIRIRPEIGDHVQQLRLQLSVLPYGHTSVSYEQLRSLKAWAATIGITIADETWVGAMKYDNETDNSLIGAMEYEETCIAILCVMLFYYLRNVEEITFATSHDFCNAIRCQLQDSHLEPMQESPAISGIRTRFTLV
ncbi:amidophosphoribosyltransferase [Colletotrichum higginsianum]|nr:amidophosphoribosyltransferase [Colletotrichum higginsianum]